MPIRWDDTDWPILRVHYEGTSTIADLEAYHRGMLALMERSEREDQPFVVVGDGSNAAPHSFAQRKMTAEFVDRHEARIRKTMLGSYWAMPGPLRRSVLAAVLWLRPPPMPIVGFATYAEAERRARDVLDASMRKTSSDLFP